MYPTNELNYPVTISPANRNITGSSKNDSLSIILSTNIDRKNIVNNQTDRPFHTEKNPLCGDGRPSSPCEDNTVVETVAPSVYTAAQNDMASHE